MGVNLLAVLDHMEGQCVWWAMTVKNWEERRSSPSPEFSTRENAEG
jgi:hypothetical protein